jgi:hypothetical protein
MAMDNTNARMAYGATMHWDHISATTTYVMWHEERFWDVGVLQRVLVSNLVKKGIVCL